MKNTIQKILVRLPNPVGDTVMATPLLRAIRKNAPQSEIVLLGHSRFRDLLEGLPWYDRFIEISGSIWKQGLELRKERFDVAFLCPNTRSSALMSSLAGVGRSIGFGRHGRSLLLTDPLSVAPEYFYKKIYTLPMHLYYAKLLEPLNWNCADLSTELTLNSHDEKTVNQFFQKHHLIHQKTVIFVPIAGFGHAKLWVPERWVELGFELYKKYNLRTLAISGPGEEELLLKLESLSKNAIITTARIKMTLGLLKSLMHKSKITVSTDSGPSHVSTAFGIPTIVLMGPNHPGLSETGHSYRKVIHEKLECSPCHKKACPLGHHKCMKEITVEKVLSKIQDLLIS